MQTDQILNHDHPFIHGQLQTPEYARHHSRTFVLMTMKSPAVLFVVALCGWFSDIVKDCSPPKPKIIRDGTYVVKNLQGVKEVVFVRPVANVLHTVERDEFRKELLE